MWRIVIVLLIVGLCVNTAAALPGSGTEADPWRIESLSDFNEFAADANYWAGYTRLETDVNLAGLSYSTAVIAPDIDNSNYVFDGIAFTGVFDGNDHNIINLTIDGGAGNGYLGLFGYIDDGEIWNVGLEGGSVSGDNRYVGGLVGENWGNILNCYSTGDVTGSDNGDSYVGGLVGDNWESISNCYSTGSVSANGKVGGLVGRNSEGSVSNCCSTGDVTGRNCVGSLVGHNWYGTVSNCYSIGSVIGYWSVGGLMGNNLDGFVSDCYSTGDVSGYQAVGGLVGKNYEGSVSNSFSAGDVSGNHIVGGLMGHNEWGGSVWNCYSAGNVSGYEDIGGLVGYNLSSSVSNCFWDTDIQIDGVTESIGLNTGGTINNVLGLTTAEMQTESTFTDADWDFITPIWTIDEGLNYPRLCWETLVLHAEPEVTVWTSNRISWEPVVGAVEYYAECAEDANFDNIVYNSGWITETSYEFIGLELGQRYWYRVKARNPAGMESKWSNVESSLQCTVAEAIEIVLESINLKNENLKETYINKINTAQEMIDSGNLTSALNKLENDILPKTDGCGETGEPDDNDWIITCEEQDVVYPLIIETIEYVKSLMQ